MGVNSEEGEKEILGRQSANAANLAGGARTVAEALFEGVEK